MGLGCAQKRERGEALTETQSAQVESPKKTCRYVDMTYSKNSIDRELFHSWLWENRGRGDIVSITQREMAKRLHVSKYTPSRMMIQLQAAGALIKMRGKFIVIDPAKVDRIL